MKIATYNVNGINGRLPVLLRWLKQDKPDVVCRQELKCSDARFPERELQPQGIETPGIVLVQVHASRMHYWDGEDEGEVAV
ncbi:exonuclease III [Bosea sp. OAE752]